MSNTAIRWALKARTNNSTQKTVLLVLADHADPSGRAFPNQKMISKEACCSLDSVQRALKDLRKLNLLRSEAAYDRRGRRARNVYWLAIDTVVKPQNAAQEIEPSRNLRGSEGGQFAGDHILNPHIEPSERGGSLSEDCFRSKEESEEAASYDIPIRTPLPSSEQCASPRQNARSIRQPLPPDWLPTSAQFGTAIERGLTSDEIHDQAKRFRVRKAASTSGDWDGEWDIWVDRAVAYKVQHANKSTQSIMALRAYTSPTSTPTPTNPYVSDDPEYEYRILPEHPIWSSWMRSFSNGGRDDWVEEARKRGVIYAPALNPKYAPRFRFGKTNEGSDAGTLPAQPRQ